MPKNPKDTEKDMAAFHEAMKGTKPLSQNKIRLSPPLNKPNPPLRQQFKSDEEKLIKATESIPPVESEDFLTYKQVSISDKILRNLRKGQYNIEATLDLHGMTANEAMDAVEDFLQACLADGVRVALIIHGKGYHSKGPVLKNKLNQWLRSIDAVLAFCSAAPQHGSRGASYVLLKRTK